MRMSFFRALTMVALAVDSKDKVDAVYRKAMELGAQDEGPAGPRSEAFYAGYFRDLDGNKVLLTCASGGYQKSSGVGGKGRDDGALASVSTQWTGRQLPKRAQDTPCEAHTRGEDEF